MKIDFSALAGQHNAEISRYLHQRDDDKDYKDDYSVALVGTGGVLETVGVLIATQERRYYDRIGINKIYIVSQDLKRAKGLEMVLKDIRRKLDMPAEVENDLAIESLDYSGLWAHSDEIDWMVIGKANQPKNKKVKSKVPLDPDFRLQLTRNNIGCIDDIIAPYDPSKPFKGGISIVTNQSDILTNYTAHRLGIDPRQLNSVNHLDTMRQWEFILELAGKHSSLDPEIVHRFLPMVAYTIGPHAPSTVDVQGMVSTVSKIADAGIASDTVNSIMRLNDAIKGKVMYRANDEKDLTGSVPTSPGAIAVMHTLKAMMLEQTPVGAGSYLTGHEPMFMLDPDRPKYQHLIDQIEGGMHIGFPTYFKRFRTEPLPPWGSEKGRGMALRWFSCIPLEDKIAFWQSAVEYHKIFKGIMRDLGLPLRQLHVGDSNYEIIRPNSQRKDAAATVINVSSPPPSPGQHELEKIFNALYLGIESFAVNRIKKYGTSRPEDVIINLDQRDALVQIAKDLSAEYQSKLKQLDAKLLARARADADRIREYSSVRALGLSSDKLDAKLKKEGFADRKTTNAAFKKLIQSWHPFMSTHDTGQNRMYSK